MLIDPIPMYSKEDFIVLGLPEPGEEIAKLEIYIGLKPDDSEHPEHHGDPTSVKVVYNGEEIKHLTHFSFTADIDTIPSISYRQRVV